LMLQNKYQLQIPPPFTVGSEGSGVIIEIHPSVKQFKVGDAVVAGMSVGSMAEEMVVSAVACVPKPKSFTHAQASAVSVGFSTAYHGLVQRGNLKSGEVLLVTGAAGGMGIAAIQLGKLLGATVIAAASTNKKVEVAKKVGADYVINYATQDMKEEVNKITNGKFADVIYEIVGGDVFEKCVRCIGDQGRLLVIGFASGQIPKIAANLPLVKGFSVVGVRAGASMMLHPELAVEMSQQLTKWTSEGKLVPHIEHVYDIAHVKDAFTVVADREVVGKSVVLFVPEKSKL